MTEAAAAVAAVERMRAALAKQLQAARMPKVSQGELFVDALARAVAALLAPKSGGRSCTLVSEATGSAALETQ